VEEMNKKELKKLNDIVNVLIICLEGRDNRTKKILSFNDIDNLLHSAKSDLAKLLIYRGEKK